MSTSQAVSCSDSGNMWQHHKTGSPPTRCGDVPQHSLLGADVENELLAGASGSGLPAPTGFNTKARLPMQIKKVTSHQLHQLTTPAPGLDSR
jgi:hypothetical protein